MRRLAGFSWEVLVKHTRAQLGRQQGWIVAGLTGPVLVTAYAIISPFEIRAAFFDFRRAALLLAAWYVLFAGYYVLWHWLRPHSARKNDEMTHTPLPAVQFMLHRSSDLCALPLLAALLSFPLYGAMLLYFGDPYNSGSSATWAYGWFHGYWYAKTLNPWAWRVFFIGLNIAAATLLPLSIGVLLQETTSWKPGRIGLFCAIPAALYYVVERGETMYFRMCYRQTRGYEPWAYIIVFAIIVLMPLLLGWLKPNGRRLLAVALMVTIVAFSLLLLLTQPYSNEADWLASLRDIFGDFRFTLAYFIGHLRLDLNIDLLLTRYQSNVLLDDCMAGNGIPQRVSMWVGAGIYPVLLAVQSFLLLGLGVVLRRRHPAE